MHPSYNALIALLRANNTSNPFELNKENNINTRDRKYSEQSTVRFQPAVRQFLDNQVEALGIPLSGLLNIILTGVMQEAVNPVLAQTTTVHERFWLLMDAHGLDALQVAQLLTPFNIRLSVLEDRERTLDYLTQDVIRQLAHWFHVDDAWLCGRSETTVRLADPNGPAQWSGRVEDIARELPLSQVTVFSSLGGMTPEQSLPDVDVGTGHQVGLYATARQNINGVRISTIRLYAQMPLHDPQVREDCRQLNALCRKKSLHGNQQLHYRQFTPAQMAALRHPTTLPILLTGGYQRLNINRE